jgi:hypothetical protein
MSGMRQKIQYSLALEPVDQGETPVSGYQGTEPFVAKSTSESPASAEQLMEEVCDRENLVRAWKRVRSNQGSPGMDGMTIDDAKDHLREHWPSIRSQWHYASRPDAAGITLAGVVLHVRYSFPSSHPEKRNGGKARFRGAVAGSGGRFGWTARGNAPRSRRIGSGCATGSTPSRCGQRAFR